MREIEGFTERGPRSTRYPFPKMRLGKVCELSAGEDYDGGKPENVIRAAHAWAGRHTTADGKPMKAVTSSLPEKGTVEIMFTEKEPVDG